MSTTTTTFNWTEFLSRDPAGITHAEWDDAHWNAHLWPSCACGNLCASLPKRYGHAPADEALFALGGDFTIYISKHEHSHARETFEQIEARTTYLLQQQRQVELAERSW